MSGITLADVALRTFKRGLKTFDHILTKAEEFALEKGLDANSEYPGARLIDDQNPLIFQVQNATRTMRVNVNRLTGTDSKHFEDTEVTLEDLHARIRAALELLDTVDPEVANSRADVIVELRAGGKPISLPVKDAVLLHGVPNFMFHITTGYSILRAKGVPLGKFDYIGSFVGL